VFCFDRVQQYDIVEVVHGPKKNKTGHVIAIQPNGYLWIKEIANRPMKGLLHKDNSNKIVSATPFEYSS
jgi:ribosomal protein L24